VVAAVLAAAVELEVDLEGEQEVAVVVAEVALVSFDLHSLKPLEFGLRTAILLVG
jgi:hypothetical protein